VAGGEGLTVKWVKVQTGDGLQSGWCLEKELGPGGVDALAADELVSFLNANGLMEYTSRLKARPVAPARHHWDPPYTALTQKRATTGHGSGDGGRPRQAGAAVLPGDGDG
jgi:hypothetical protein